MNFQEEETKKRTGTDGRKKFRNVIVTWKMAIYLDIFLLNPGKKIFNNEIIAKDSEGGLNQFIM